MRASVQILTTVLLVAAGLLVYDALGPRRDVVPAGGASPVRSDVERSAPDGAAADAAPAPFPLLVGTGDEVWRADVERRLAALESRTTAGTAAAEDATPPAPGTVGDAVDETAQATGSDAPSGGTRASPARPAVSPEQVRRFRTLLEAVERQRRLERAVKEIGAFLDQTGAKLTDGERRAVIATAVRYQARWRDEQGQLKGEGHTDAERKAASASLLAEFEGALRDEVPAAEADLIVQAVQRVSAGNKSR